LLPTAPQCGLAQLPKDPFMIILSSSFLIDVQQSYQSGLSQLAMAKKLVSDVGVERGLQQHKRRD
jgi:hypothetical protein